MSGHCPVCGVVLPLSGEPNCYCEPVDATGTPKTGPRTADGAERAHVDPLTPDEALEGR